MHVHRPLLAATVLLAGAALAQSTGAGASSTQTTNPRPESTGSVTTPPGSSETETRSGANPGGEPLTTPVSSALGTTPSPKMVLADLHLANQSEVDLGKLAESKAQAKEVKKFAKHMVKAHTEMDKEAQKWAKKHNITIGAPPQAEMQKMQETKQGLERLSGAEFDKAYMQAMADAHANDLNKVRTFEQQAIDTDFQKLLTKVRKEIAGHKREADTLVQKLGSTASR